MIRAVFRSGQVERRFVNHVETVSAHTADQSLDALRRIGQAVSHGLHAAGYVSYEAAPGFDPVMRTHPPGNLPAVCFGLFREVEVGEGNVAPQASRGSAIPRMNWRSRISEQDYLRAVDRIRAWIAAGDTYQVNYTFPLVASLPETADRTAFLRAMFDRLCQAQASNYAAYLDFGPRQILSVSPELFFRLDGTRLTSRPMKGTRPRGLWAAHDQAIAEELARSQKDRAENVMIVDLLRNDMGRISRIGTVHVPSLFDIERYETVWQMTSTIESETKVDLPDIFQALFPCGSVTGAPKIRTMEIIHALEPFPRGVYCGAVGWCSPGRQAVFNVAIRTAVADSRRGQIEYHVGSGITWDSAPHAEYQECLDKAALLDYSRPRFALLESLRLDEDGYFLLAEHLDRLAASAAYFGFLFDRYAALQRLESERRTLKLRVTAEGPLKVRVTVARDGALHLEASPVAVRKPTRAALAREPIHPENRFLYHKTTHRAVYERAAASRPDCDDVLLWNARGELTESTIANLVLRLNGQLLTPPITSGLLPGIFRNHLLRTRQLREAVLIREDLRRAEAVYLINSVRKWMEVALADD